jgi:hypothetical protein
MEHTLQEMRLVIAIVTERCGAIPRLPDFQRHSEMLIDVMEGTS